MPVLCLALKGYLLVLFLHVILSWVPRLPEPFVPVASGIDKVVRPLLDPLDRVIPPIQLGGVGLRVGILVLFFGIQILIGLLKCS